MLMRILFLLLAGFAVSFHEDVKSVQASIESFEERIIERNETKL